MTRALALISGDKDSTLSAKLIKQQGIDVIGVCFKSAFFSYESAVKEAEKIDIELKIVDITDEHFEIIKNNVGSYSNIKNLCIGCNLLRMSYAARLLEEIEGDFIVTGESLNDGIVSQNTLQSNIVVKGFNLGELILRPRGAEDLKPTIMEQSGIVDRSKVIKYSNDPDRMRVEFSSEIGTKDLYHFKGQCKLSDPIFASRLKNILDYNKNCTPRDIEILGLDNN
jgi:tRNA-uridine 2-sulfurtransferase